MAKNVGDRPSRMLEYRAIRYMYSVVEGAISV